VADNVVGHSGNHGAPGASGAGIRTRKGTPMSFWDFFLLMIWSYIFIAYLILLFHIVKDVFRDPDLGGGAKALWIIGLIVVPFLIALIYVITRGRGMAERRAAADRQARAETDQYIQSVASTSSPAQQISSAKGLLDSGSITQAEFDQLKAKALA
jgi:hypothetical protein